MGVSLSQIQLAACVRNLRNVHPFDPAIPVQEIYPKNIYIYPKEVIPKVSKDVCTRIFDYSIRYNKILEALDVHVYGIG